MSSERSVILNMCYKDCYDLHLIFCFLLWCYFKKPFCRYKISDAFLSSNEFLSGVITPTGLEFTSNLIQTARLEVINHFVFQKWNTKSWRLVLKKFFQDYSWIKSSPSTFFFRQEDELVYKLTAISDYPVLLGILFTCNLSWYVIVLVCFIHFFP